MKYEVSDGICTITMNRPERLNAMNGQWFEDFGAALERANWDEAVRVVMITGSGRGFCAGGDMKEDLEVLGAVGDRIMRKSPASTGISLFTLQLYNLEKPSIAVVNGPAVGGGFAVALACDIVLASERATFSEIFIDRGLLPDSGTTYLLPRLVGFNKASELIFTGAMVDAAEAARLGIANHVVPHEELWAAALELAQTIASKPPEALRLAKRALQQGVCAPDLASAADYALLLQRMCSYTEDHAERKKAFAEGHA